MDFRGANTRIGAFRLWVLVFLLVFLALCGVHLFVLHHDGDPHALELAAAIGLVLAAIVGVTLSRRHCNAVSARTSMLYDLVLLFKIPPGPTLASFAPMRT